MPTIVNKHQVIRLAMAGLMIIVGAAIYIISRHDIIFFDWMPSSLIENKGGLEVKELSLPVYFTVYCLPDGLWYGSLLLFQYTFLDKTSISIYLFQISILLPFVWELLQIYDDVPGTFDPLDLLAYLLTLLIFKIFTNRHVQE